MAELEITRAHMKLASTYSNLHSLLQHMRGSGNLSIPEAGGEEDEWGFTTPWPFATESQNLETTSDIQEPQNTDVQGPNVHKYQDLELVEALEGPTISVPCWS